MTEAAVADKKSVLAGVRVVDFGQYVAGPLVAQLLADFGADVVRVDPPGGPVWKADGNALLQRGKRSIVLDLKKPADVAIARDLMDRADVVVENFRPGVMDRLGLGWKDAEARNPRLIYCSIPGFASSDPRSATYATEGVVSAAAGLYPTHGFDPDGEPIVTCLPLASVMAAIISAHATVAALIARLRCGRGQRIETSLYDAAFEIIRFYTDKPPQEKRVRIQLGGPRPVAIARAYKCQDGRYVRVSWLEKRQIEAFARFVGKYDDWKAKGLLDIGVERVVKDRSAGDALAKEAEAIFITQTAEHWEKVIGAEADLIAIRTSEEFLVYDEQAKAIDASVRLLDPEFGVTYQGGAPLNLSGTPAAPKPRHALDADRAAILAELEQALPKFEAQGEALGLKAALQDIRAIDMTVLLAGPGAGRILGEYGADVVHLGNPKWHGMKFHYQVHIGKRTVLLDLKKPESRKIFQRLIEKADIISTNFSQSVARRLGVDDQSVRKIRPDVVYSRISAHGGTGPREEFRGHEEVGQAATGALIRFAKNPEGQMQLFAVNDSATGHVAAFGMLLSLYHRLKGGAGQFVGASLAQTSVLYQAPFMVAHARRDWDSDAGGLDYRGSGPLDHVYKAADGRWIYLAADGSQGLAELAKAFGLNAPALSASEAAEASKLQAALVGLIAQAPAQSWVSRATGLRHAGVSMVATVDEPMSDPWARANGLAQEVDFPEAGVGLQVGPAPRMSLTPMKLGVPVGPPGSDTERVLQDIGLGNELQALIDAGAVAVEQQEPAEAH
jgi:crotonobetainyl-CoA:carnitine CoA-transferase CaiB-like acyl-CoA transferase